MIDAAASAVEERRERVEAAILACETSDWNREGGAQEVFAAKRIGNGGIRGDEGSAVASPHNRILHGIYEVEVSRIDINQGQIQMCALGAHVRGFHNGIPCDFI